MSSERVFVHASSLPTFQDDQRRWAADNLGKKRPGEGESGLPQRNIGAFIGDHAHAAAKLMLQQKQGGHDPRIEDVIELVVSDYRANAKKHALQTDKLTKNTGDGEIQMIRQIRTWADCYLPKVVPLFIEEKFSYEYDDLITIVGQPDLILSLGGNAIGIDDNKFGGIGKHNFMAQLGLYMMLCRVQPWFLDGFSIPRIGIVKTPRVGLKSPQPDTNVIQLPPMACWNAAEDALKDIRRAVLLHRETGDIRAFRANPNSKFCTQNTCSFWGTERCDQGGHEIDGDEY